ncbi:hypothetical protein EYD00_15070 [Agrobacterium sp. 33MFTa1.1]|nr:hypothetical protein EYD00_15070 [Agrobacterium sp. 33MFTa1.1]
MNFTHQPASPPSFLCLSQEFSPHASTWRKDSPQPKDLGWLDSCDEQRDEERKPHPLATPWFPFGKPEANALYHLPLFFTVRTWVS